jgi:hypothetical protein
MRAFLASLLLLTALPAFAQVSSDTFGDDEEVTAEKKRDWTFAQPGKTATRTAFNIAGKPNRDYEGRVIQGEMDVLLAPAVEGKDDPLLVQRAKNMGKGLSFVHVLEYDETAGRTTLVFRDDVLWYIVQPTRTGETKQEEVSRRFGDSPKMSSQRRKVEGAEHSARIHWFPESGVGFVQLDGAESYAYKLVYEAKAVKPRN